MTACILGNTMSKSFESRMIAGAARAAEARHSGKAWGNVRSDRFRKSNPEPTLDDILENAVGRALDQMVRGWNWLERGGRPVISDDDIPF